MPRLTLSAVALVCLALTGCAGPTSVVPVKNVMADPDAYQESKFSSAVLPERVRSALPLMTHSGWTKLDIKREVTITDNKVDPKVEKVETNTTYATLTNGLMSLRHEVSSNGIPFRINYSMSQDGLLTLRHQTIPLRGQASSPIYEIKSITSISPFIAPDSQWAVKYESSTATAIQNFIMLEMKCDTGPRFPAGQLLSRLPGTAFELKCAESYQNSVRSRMKFVYLEQYGIAVMTENANLESTTVYKIVDVKM